MDDYPYASVHGGHSPAGQYDHADCEHVDAPLRGGIPDGHGLLANDLRVCGKDIYHHGILRHWRSLPDLFEQCGKRVSG